MRVELTVNGVAQAVEADPMARLLDVLRVGLGLTGTKEGCGEGECGACTVIVDGALACACLVPVCQAHGAAVTTIEGVAFADKLHPLQAHFAEDGGAQCGICTPGMIVAAKLFLDRSHAPTREEIRTAIAGNLCRCTGYQRIVDAVAAAAAEAAGGGGGAR
jgi:carbon-monoxide dehydrogenase small subunit